MRSAVEMPGPWKTWRTRLRFPKFPTAPWKSPRGRFPHSHRASDDSPYRNPKPTRHGSRPSGAHRNAKKARRPPKERACRNHHRQGINYVFWVDFLWPVLRCPPRCSDEIGDSGEEAVSLYPFSVGSGCTCTLLLLPDRQPLSGSHFSGCHDRHRLSSSPC